MKRNEITSIYFMYKDLLHQGKVTTVLADKSFHLLMEHHNKVIMDILQINKDNLQQGR